MVKINQFYYLVKTFALFFLGSLITQSVYAEMNHTINIYNHTNETITFKYHDNDCIPDHSDNNGNFSVSPGTSYSFGLKDRNTLNKCRHTKTITYYFSSPVLFSSGNSNFTFKHNGTTGGSWRSWVDMYVNEGSFGYGGIQAFPGTVTCNGSDCASGNSVEGDNASVAINFNQPANNANSINGSLLNLSNYLVSVGKPSSNSNCNLTTTGNIPIGSLFNAILNPSIYGNTSCGVSTSTSTIGQQTNFGLQTTYSFQSIITSYLSGSTGNIDSSAKTPDKSSFVSCINMDPNNINNVMYKYTSSPAQCWLGCSATASGNKVMYKYYHSNKSSATAVTLIKLP